MSTPGAKRITESAYWRISTEKDVLFEDGEFPNTIAILAWEVLWRPKDYQTITELGWMYGNTERWDLELATYIRFRNAYPEWSEAYYPEAEFYFNKHVYKPVVTLLEPTISFEIKPHANSYRLLAHAYDRLGFYKESLQTWETYIKLMPGDGAALVNRDKVKKKLSDGKS